MSNEQTIYLSPLCDWRIVMCSKLWGITGYEVERFVPEGRFWKSMFDGEYSLGECFLYLKKKNIISKDEMNAELKKWVK